MSRVLSAIAFAIGVMVASTPVIAMDEYEPDNGPGPGFNAGPRYFELIPGQPQTRDIDRSPDVDWFTVVTWPYHSYEARLFNAEAGLFYSFGRHYAFGGALLQAADHENSPGSGGGDPLILRWQVGNLSGGDLLNLLRVQGWHASPPRATYSAVFQDTTLFCPRYNNTGGQTSVLFVQAAPEGRTDCVFDALFSMSPAC
jgi:hypothetical protein